VIALRPQHRWLCVDLPGYGASAPLAGDVSDQPRAAAFATALAKDLDRLGLTRVNVLAQSLGGAVALHLAARRPEAVGRIVLIGSQPTAAPGGVDSVSRDAGVGPRARVEYYGGDGPSLEKMRQLIARLEWHDGDAVPEATVRARYRASIAPTALLDTTSDPGPADPGDALADVAAPTLVIWGRHDAFAGPDYAAALADALPRGDLAVLGRTAHHPQAERPELVAGLFDVFTGEQA
jgi:pimeloyl-ACP methyl ester carboxylesterase